MKIYDSVKKEEVEIADYKDLIKIMKDGRQVDLYLKEKKSDDMGYLTWDVEHWSSVSDTRFIRCYSLEGRVLGDSTISMIWRTILSRKRQKRSSSAKTVFSQGGGVKTAALFFAGTGSFPGGSRPRKTVILPRSFAEKP